MKILDAIAGCLLLVSAVKAAKADGKLTQDELLSISYVYLPGILKAFGVTLD